MSDSTHEQLPGLVSPSPSPPPSNPILPRQDSIESVALDDDDLDEHEAFLSALRSGSQSRMRRRIRVPSGPNTNATPLLPLPSMVTITSRERSTARHPADLDDNNISDGEEEEEERRQRAGVVFRSLSPISPWVQLRSLPRRNQSTSPPPSTSIRSPRLLVPDSPDFDEPQFTFVDRDGMNGRELRDSWDELNWIPEDSRTRVEMEEVEGRNEDEQEDDEVGLDLFEGTRVWRNDPIDVSRTSRIARGGRSLANETLFESAEEVEFRRRSQAPPPTTYSRPPPPAQPSDSRQHLDSLRVAGQRWAHWGNPGLDWGPPLPFGSSSRDAPRQSEAERERVRDRAPGRDRDETNALIGQTLRTKKDCLLVYCGARKEEPLPKGFTFKNEGSEKVSSVGGGCGALVCARGLGGVPKRLFEQTEGEEETVSSDLPPLAERVGDVEKGKEQKSMRGLNGCEGCRTKDIGCRACGNILGFRVVRPCHPCSKVRILTTDGYFWHYRFASVTTLPRLNGVLPLSNISLSPPPSPCRSPPPIFRPALLSSTTGRLELVQTPEEGSKMFWSHVPHPQADWEDGLVGEPKDWVNEDDSEDEDYSWVEGLARFCKGGREPERPSAATRFTPTREEWSVPLPSWERPRDRSRRPLPTLPLATAPWAIPLLSSASRHVQIPSPDTNQSTNPTNIFSPRSPPSTLVRSHAIRVSRALSPGSGVGRRVRQRRSEEIERVVREAGYGSAFDTGGSDRERSRVRRRASESGGRRGSNATVAGR